MQYHYLYWQARASQLGFDAKAFIERRDKQPAHSFLSDIKEKLLVLVSKLKREAKPSALEAALSCVQVATETLSQRTAIFSERELLTEAMKHSLIYPERVSQQAIIQAIDHEIKCQSFYEARCNDRGERLLTTPWLLTLEAETIERIERNKGAVPALASLQTVNAFQKEHAPCLPYPMTRSQKKR
ncbi:conjugative transfer protein TraI [Legionella beliardensis]|uniref:Conjugative transfer protein TraI n=1 Tax=Legionella beliardensis TaxID=91822 RepID=A0A378JQC6_9GAMM|nr:hypothetical protein [Legionella beliardensis]STX55807.1 conjugative transfer protein TraI [Legionella beliardensis]